MSKLTEGLFAVGLFLVHLFLAVVGLALILAPFIWLAGLLFS